MNEEVKQEEVEVEEIEATKKKDPRSRAERVVDSLNLPIRKKARKKRPIRTAKKDCRWHLALYVPDEHRAIIKRFCILAHCSTQVLLERLIDEWVQHKLKHDPNFLETMKQERDNFTEFVTEELAKQVAMKRYKEL